MEVIYPQDFTVHGIVIQLGGSYQPHHKTPENTSPSSLFTQSPTFQPETQSGLCGLPLSVISLVLLIWASCWEHGLLIHCSKRRLIELVKSEAVRVLIRRYLTSLEDPGGAWKNIFLIDFIFYLGLLLPLSKNFMLMLIQHSDPILTVNVREDSGRFLTGQLNKTFKVWFTY